MAPDRAIISGLGFVTSIGNDRAAVAASLRRLRSGIEWGEFTREFASAGRATGICGTIKDFATASVQRSEWRWPAAYAFSPELLGHLTPAGLYGVCALKQALADAGLAGSELGDEGTRFYCVSAGVAGLKFALAACFGVRGPTELFASSGRALAAALEEIRSGRRRRIAVVAAQDISGDPLMPCGAISRQSDPARASRPFDRGSDGLVPTGGAAVLILEAEGDARRRGAGPYAELRGWGGAPADLPGSAADAEGAGTAAAMAQALVAAGVEAGELDYVNAHAPSNPVQDPAEARALHAVFTARGAQPAVSSTKALTGHGRAMAATMEMAFCALALKEGFVPGAANLDNPHPACDGLNLPRATQERRLRFVLKNCRDPGGGHVSLVLGRAR
jgi:3-oxoacyl-(acyl-carrier-protein) synthase